MADTIEIAVTTLENKASGKLTLSKDVFGLPPRADLLQRYVIWQLAKRQQGTHKTKTYGEVAGSTRKIVNQKGSGGARHGGIRAPQFRGGGKAFGPVPHSHAIDLPKKVRKLALKTALSTKLAEGKLKVVDNAVLQVGKTKELAGKLKGLGLESALVIDGKTLDENFARAVRSLRHVDVLPEQGANVYDILRRDTLVLTKAAVEALEARLK
ncbi:50S ribosomal protein L4 [Ferrovibrio sp.]|uniref:50S ribosomal protein L4 n=1 Tax=Ferrovibrio sp. TaxID=1917215 RepID=UPI002624C98B|nr:50S ribosomal protein L4 [Ferrovibrio sp.]